MRLVHLSLLLVVVVDVMGQGLVLPIVNTLILEPKESILPSETSLATRQLDYGVVIGVFFLSWFLGAPYISKLSDTIGRKEAILVCLAGALGSYFLTIAALYMKSFALLLLGRAISGFTAGNQPIAQAALVDMSRDEDEKTRYMGLVVMAGSMGLLAGPLLGGLLSDKDLLGDLASLELPFYGAAVLVLLNMALIVLFFHNSPFERKPFKFIPAEVLLTLWRVTKKPLVLKLSAVFFFSQLSFNCFFIFLDTYLLRRFQFDTLQNAIALMVFGVALGLASAFLVTPLNKRFPKTAIVFGTQIAMAASAVAFLVNGSPFLAYFLIVPFVVAWAVNYPTMLTLFSAAVDATEQGWVMGVTVAVYTLGAGLISLIGSELMAIDIRAPFIVAIASLGVAFALALALWRGEEIAGLDKR